jgi:hypothetical protein
MFITQFALARVSTANKALLLIPFLADINLLGRSPGLAGAERIVSRRAFG